jgi:hypothetical protein
VECDLIAWASVCAKVPEIPSLRKSPGKLGESAIAPGLLKHADEQTVVGLAAVLRAVSEGGLDPAGFCDWAVLAAPRFLGRAAFLRSFPQYQSEGAWGVSPHLIPAHSLHSPSGTISQVLKAHGTNLGVGGTPGSENEAMLLAGSMLASGTLPGVWIVLTGHQDRSDDEAGSGEYEAVALALAIHCQDHPGPSLRIAPDSVTLTAASDHVEGLLTPWFASAHLRFDRGHNGQSIRPAPHFRPKRSATPNEK